MGRISLRDRIIYRTSVRITGGETNADLFVETAFLPPTATCLRYIIPDLNTPVIPDTLNNFQMVMPAGNARFNLQYGFRSSSISTHG